MTRFFPPTICARPVTRSRAGFSLANRASTRESTATAFLADIVFHPTNQHNGIGLTQSEPFRKLLSEVSDVFSRNEECLWKQESFPVPLATHGQLMDNHQEKTKSNQRAVPVVLAVDDDPAVLRIIESQLTRHDYVVKTAASGEEALRILRELTPAVLILDVMMGGISGYDLCTVVKRDPRLHDVPVIFLTSRGTPQDYKTGHELGAVIYMVKPFKPEKLLNIVQMLISVSA